MGFSLPAPANVSVVWTVYPVAGGRLGPRRVVEIFGIPWKPGGVMRVLHKQRVF